MERKIFLKLEELEERIENCSKNDSHKIKQTLIEMKIKYANDEEVISKINELMNQLEVNCNG